VTGDRSWLRYDAASRRALLTLHIQPNTRKTGVVDLHGDALKIRIAAPAANNKANAALIGFLSETLQLPKSAIMIRHGATARRKVVEIIAGPALASAIERVLTGI
jgi:uncharacterized protein (TIGR00251 family)